MYIKHFSKYTWIPVIFLMTGILFSCVNDLESIRKVTFKPTDPDERTSDLAIYYNDSGYAKVEIFAKLAETYSKPEQVIKFKDGIKVHFYDEAGEIKSILTALYGEIQEERGRVFVRDSVQLFNVEQNKRLETEELHWNRKDSTIYSDKPVIIRTEDALFFGEGVRTKQDFSSYEFIRPTGKINLDKSNK
jgi:LPS export ABC transporter protein LptC